MVSFYTSWKHQKTGGFMLVKGGIERDTWREMNQFRATSAQSSYVLDILDWYLFVTIVIVVVL